MPSVQTHTLMTQNVKKAKIPLYLSDEKSYALESATTLSESKRKTGKSLLGKNIFSFK